MNHFSEKVSFIWSVADLLRGPYKPPQYGRVILPLTVLRRLDCALEPTKEKVLAKLAGLKGSKVANIEPILNRVTRVPFHNTSNRPHTEHTTFVGGQHDASHVGPLSSFRYFLAPTLSTRLPATINIEWVDESGESGTYTTTLT